MKKIFVAMIFMTLFGGSAALAQTFMHSLGASILFGNGKAVDDGAGGSITPTLGLEAITYYPRINLIESDNSSISVGIPLSLGFQGSVNTQTGSSIAFGYDLPLVVDYNMGHKSTLDNEAGFGGYIGAGFGYTHTSVSISDNYLGDYSATANTYGPLVRAGIRFGIPWGEKEYSYTIGGWYKFGLEKDGFKTIGINLLWDF
jgi:hypothetical protein